MKNNGLWLTIAVMIVGFITYAVVRRLTTGEFDWQSAAIFAFAFGVIYGGLTRLRARGR